MLEAIRPARAGQERTAAGQRWAVLAVMCTGYFLVLLDVTIVNVALPQIAAGLRVGVSGLQWVVDGYALALASLMLAGGTIGDARGHRRMVLTGLAVFGAGSLGCALAPGIAVLIAARVVQGIGAALLLPGTLAIISRAFPGGREQARAIGIWAGIGSLALPAGPLLGGALIAGFGWRAIFWLNVPVVVLALIAVLAIARDGDHDAGRRAGNVRDRTGDGEGQRARALDLRGVTLGGLLLLALTLAFIQGGRSGPGSPVVLAAAAAALLLAVAFVLAERRRGEAAMLPLPLFRRPAFSAANAAAAVMNLGTLGTLFVLTLFLQSVQGRSPLAAGLALVPLFAPLAVLAPLAGRLTGRTGPRMPATAGFAVAAAGLALLAAAGTQTGYPVLLAAFLIWGTGMGFMTPALVAAAIAAVPPGRAGLASAINNTARQAGGAIGIAVAGAIAGQPAGRHGGSTAFVHGFHVVALGAAGAYLLAACAALILIPRHQPASG